MLKRLFSSLFIAAFSILNFQAQNEVLYIWSGALTPTSIKVNAKLTSNSDSVRLVISEKSDLSLPRFSAYTYAGASNNLMASLRFDSLAPNTKYYYAIEADGEIDSSTDDIGTFVTPKPGAFSYSFVTGSCAFNSDHPVFDVMSGLNPLFYLNTGDLHYADPNSSQINYHRLPYETHVLSKSRTASLLRKTPLTYMWDDHDFSGNESNALSIGKISARLAYQEYVPHYPLAAGLGNVPIYQAFTIGRVRFILTDLRSERQSSTIMGEAQKTWFKNEVMAAKTNNLMIAWISTVSWAGDLPGNWGGYPAERTELADFFKKNEVKNMMIICGDAHMLAIDNGKNNDFSSGLSSPYKYPIFQAAALNRFGSDKGGTYSQGTFPNPDASVGQFGLVKIMDTGSEDICIELSGYRVSDAGTSEVITNYNFCRTLGGLPSFRVFPNPAKDSFTIETYEIEEAEVCTLKLFDIRGNLVFQQEINVSKEQTHIPVMLGKRLSAGAYIVNFKYKGRDFNTRLAISE